MTGTSSISGLSRSQKIGIFVNLTGDADGNGIVNIIDKVMVRNCFGQPGTGACEDADVNCDGIVNIIDKVKVRNDFGQSGCACP